MLQLSTITPHDCIVLADSVSDPFEDIHVITTKGHFLDLLTQEIPHDLIAEGDGAAIQCKIHSILESVPISVCEFVDFTTTPPTVCVNASEVGEDEMYKAFTLISKAIQANNGPKGRWSNAATITYTIGDLAHLLNWH